MPDPNDEHLICRAFFTLEVGGKTYDDMSVLMRHPFGTPWEETVEVEKPVGSFPGILGHNQFHEIADHYFRKACGFLRKAFGGLRGQVIRMRDNTVHLKASYDIEIPDAL